MNTGMDRAIELLRPVKEQFGAALTWADLIVLAGTVALETALPNQRIGFCKGRSDATEDYPRGILHPKGNWSLNNSKAWKFEAATLGLTIPEYVALSGRIRSPGQLHRLGYFNSSWSNASSLNVQSNEFFVALLGEQWTKFNFNGVEQYTNSDNSRFMTPFDMNILFDPELRSVAQDFSSNSQLYSETLVAAWRKLMNIDRFDGPTRNVCDSHEEEEEEEEEEAAEEGEGIKFSGLVVPGAILFLLGVPLVAVILRRKRAINSRVEDEFYNRF